jgi:hypothetical protein
MKSLELLNSVIEAIELLGRKIETLNSLNLTDLSVRSEEFFRAVLNRILDLDLKNINIVEPSATAIDLGDVIAGLAIQVTATGTANKVRSTISKFIESDLSSQYDRLVIVQIAREGGRRIKNVCDPKDLKFDPKADIWGKKELARQISGLPTDALKSLHDYMKLELPTLFGEVGSGTATKLRVSASYTRGGNGASVTLRVFNCDTHPRYLSMWFVDWGERAGSMSLKCESGSLPYRLKGQDEYTIVVDLERPRLEGITALGVLDGDNNRFAVPVSQIAVLKREAERRAILHPESDAKNTPDFSQCELSVRVNVNSEVGGNRSLVFTVTNKSDIPIPIIGGKLEWQYDPPRIT